MTKKYDYTGTIKLKHNEIPVKINIDNNNIILDELPVTSVPSLCSIFEYRKQGFGLTNNMKIYNMFGKEIGWIDISIKQHDHDHYAIIKNKKKTITTSAFHVFMKI